MKISAKPRQNSLLTLRNSWHHQQSINCMLYSSDSKSRINIGLIQNIRREFEGVSMMRAKEALEKSENNYEKAKEWLNEQLRKDGEKKAQKVGNRKARDGFVTLAQSPSLGAVMIEINCETDFVARNSLFQKLCTRVSSTALLLQYSPPLRDPYDSFSTSTHTHAQNNYNNDYNNNNNNHNQDKKIIKVPVGLELLEKPLLPEFSSEEFRKAAQNMLKSTSQMETIQHGLTDTIGKLGENIRLRRAVFAPFTPCSSSSLSRCFISTFVHGSGPKCNGIDGGKDENCSSSPNVQLMMGSSDTLNVHSGKIGSIVMWTAEFNDDKQQHEHQHNLKILGKQLAQHIVGINPASMEDLYSSNFLFDPSLTIQQVLDKYTTNHDALKRINIDSFERFECGQEEVEENGEIEGIWQSGGENEENLKRAAASA